MQTDTAPSPQPRQPDARHSLLDFLRLVPRYQAHLEDSHARHGDVVRQDYAGQMATDFFHPDDARDFMQHEPDDLVRWERGPEVFARLQGQSVLVTEGEVWKAQRRVLLALFHPQRLNGALPRLQQVVASEADAVLAPLVQAGAAVDLAPWFTQVSMQLIARLLFDRPLASHEVTQCSQAITELSARGMRSMFMLPWLDPEGWLSRRSAWRHHPQPFLRACGRGLDTLRHGLSTTQRGARPLRQLIERQIMQALPLATGADAHQHDDQAWVVALLRAQWPDPADHTVPLRGDAHLEAVADQCMTLFLAGHETTATSLQWWASALARSPAWMAQAHEEVRRVLEGRPPAAADLANLPVVQATLKEAMRLYPAVPALFTRRTRCPFHVGRTWLPKGEMVRVTPWVMQRDARWWPDPLVFNPQRFLVRDDHRPRGAWMPFGTGARVCVGQGLAQAEMALVAVRLLQIGTWAPHATGGPDAPMPGGRWDVTYRQASPDPMAFASLRG